METHDVTENILVTTIDSDPIVNVTIENASPVIEVDLTVGESQSQFEVGHGLFWDDSKLSVNVVNSVDEDNTLPVTSGAVFTVTGNIEALLAAL